MHEVQQAAAGMLYKQELLCLQAAATQHDFFGFSLRQVHTLPAKAKESCWVAAAWRPRGFGLSGMSGAAVPLLSFNLCSTHLTSMSYNCIQLCMSWHRALRLISLQTGSPHQRHGRLTLLKDGLCSCLRVHCTTVFGGTV